MDITNLYLDKFTDTSVLKDFKCGLQVMDNFISNGLQSRLDKNDCSAFYLHDDESVYAFFVIKVGERIKIDNDTLSDLKDIYNIETKEQTLTSIDIEYLAVDKKYQRNKIHTYKSNDIKFGYTCIDLIYKLAEKMNNISGVSIITVDAYKIEPHSAVGFYEKCNFSQLEYPNPNTDTLRMYLPIK